MKKILALVLALMLVLSLCACGKNDSSNTGTDAGANAGTASATPAPTPAPAEDTPAPAPATMTYAEFCAAALDSAVTIEAYVQSCAYNAEYGNASLFLQDTDGGYYVYRMNVTADEALSLAPGAKIKVTGYKSEWSGEVEITDATFEAVNGFWMAEAKDVTPYLNTATLADCLNQFVAFKGMTVEPSIDADGNEAAFLYNWDGSGAPGANSDLYFNVSVNGMTYNFTVESDECPEGSEVYTAVTALSIGDTVDLEGFLYWYEGANPHITSVTPAK